MVFSISGSLALIFLKRMGHFAVAFFGHHLQGREDLAYYFSEDFVAGFDDLAWGVVGVE